MGNRCRSHQRPGHLQPDVGVSVQQLVGGGLLLLRVRGGVGGHPDLLRVDGVVDGGDVPLALLLLDVLRDLDQVDVLLALGVLRSEEMMSGIQLFSGDVIDAKV